MIVAYSTPSVISPQTRPIPGRFTKGRIHIRLRPSHSRTTMQLRAFSQSACSTSRPAVGPRGVPALRCSSRPARRAAPSSQPAHVGAQVVCRAAQEQALSPEERWTAAVAEGRVINVSNKEAGELMRSGWVLLDVRPPGEVAKVAIKGAVSVPLFVEDPKNDPATLLKKWATFGTGGWWLGGTHMIPNPTFMQEVRERVPLDSKVVVGCQKGLRSLAACETLSRTGYKEVAWVNGGFDTAAAGDLPVDKDIRYAGIGGMSEVLGWTEVQQQEKKGAMGGFENVLKLVGVVLAADFLLFAYEQYAYMTGTPLPPGLQ